MTNVDVQYVTGADGKQVGVFIPIDQWRDLESERETAYLLSTEAMRNRLLGALERSENCISLEEARAKLGV